MKCARARSRPTGPTVLASAAFDDGDGLPFADRARVTRSVVDREPLVRLRGGVGHVRHRRRQPYRRGQRRREHDGRREPAQVEDPLPDHRVVHGDGPREDGLHLPSPLRAVLHTGRLPVGLRAPRLRGAPAGGADEHRDAPAPLRHREGAVGGAHGGRRGGRLHGGPHRGRIRQLHQPRDVRHLRRAALLLGALRPHAHGARLGTSRRAWPGSSSPALATGSGTSSSRRCWRGIACARSSCRRG